MASPSWRMRPARPESARNPILFVWICLAGALLFSASRISSSLWLDETATYWMVKDGLREVVSRAWVWSGQSPLYYVFAWLSFRLAHAIGMEAALRLPSLLGIAAASFLLYLLGRRLMDARMGAVAALAFLCLPDVWFAAIDARPYALALAIVLASTLSFFEWVETGRPLDAVLYVVSTALVLYAHYLFALALIPQLFYGLRRRRSIVGLWAASAALCAPLAAQVIAFYRTRAAHTFAGTPGAADLFDAIAPPVLAGTVLCALFASRNRKPEDPANRMPWSFLATWLAAPPGILFAISLFTETKLFVPRYYLSCAPAAALLAAYAVSRRSAVRLASGILLGSLLLGVYQGGAMHGREDWRGAMRAVRNQAAPEDVVLVATAFVEGTSDGALPPAIRDVLYAPQIAYGPNRFVRLPYGFEPAAIPTDLARGRRVFLITRRSTFAGYTAGLEYEGELRRRLDGYVPSRLGSFGGVSVERFEKPDATR